MQRRQKKKPSSTQRSYVFGLKTLRSLLHFKLDFLTLVQRFVAVGLDGGKMNEDILAGLALNEAIAF